jgi:hypothetical protein
LALTVADFSLLVVKAELLGEVEGEKRRNHYGKVKNKR